MHELREAKRRSDREAATQKERADRADARGKATQDRLTSLLASQSGGASDKGPSASNV